MPPVPITAMRMHPSQPCVDTRTTELYDRRRVEVSLDEAVRIVT
jgi:hypothetical protein